ncbi:MAG TPA: IMP cyclohydrolase [Candidatus Saccharimonadales bacterium]
MAQLELSPSQEAIDIGAQQLAENEYPGRVLITGLNTTGDTALQLYALMGRSPGSRLREFVPEGVSIRTTAPGKTAEEMAATKNSELIYYRAFNSRDGVHVATNGAQTDPILESILGGMSLDEATRSAPDVDGGVDGGGEPLPPIKLSWFEPDFPNSTARINSVVDKHNNGAAYIGLSIVRKDPLTGGPAYSTYEALAESLRPGVGYGIQTYKGNGDPLPTFDQDPYAYPLGRGIEDTTEDFWNRLNPATRVAAVVRGIDLISGQLTEPYIINSQAA